jgi:hypothetical protein
MFEDCFPLRIVKVSSRDPPYMSPLVKHLYVTSGTKIIANIIMRVTLLFERELTSKFVKIKLMPLMRKVKNFEKDLKVGGTLPIR